jgi:hypothetical protein
MNVTRHFAFPFFKRRKAGQLFKQESSSTRYFENFETPGFKFNGGAN